MHDPRRRNPVVEPAPVGGEERRDEAEPQGERSDPVPDPPEQGPPVAGRGAVPPHHGDPEQHLAGRLPAPADKDDEVRGVEPDPPQQQQADERSQVQQIGRPPDHMQISDEPPAGDEGPEAGAQAPPTPPAPRPPPPPRRREPRHPPPPSAVVPSPYSRRYSSQDTVTRLTKCRVSSNGICSTNRSTSSLRRAPP